MVKLFHRTSTAEGILREGFRDNEGSYGLVGVTLRGVFLSDRPLDLNEGVAGEDLLEVTLDENLLGDYELVEEGKPYREWCVPADLLNRHASIRRADGDCTEANENVRRFGGVGVPPKPAKPE